MTTSPKSSASPDNPWFAVSMVLIGLVVGYGVSVATGGASLGNAGPAKVVEAPAPAPAPTPTPAAPVAKDVVAPDPKTDNIRGDEKALISVIEYSDFQCPFCTRHHPTMQRIVDEIDDVNWVFRHYPLNFHPQAQISAEASECAKDQDKFWEFADKVFEEGSKEKDGLIAYATDLGLNAATFTDCLESGKYTQYVKDQMAQGSASGVSGTPGNIVYNNKTKESKLVSGAQSFENFKAAIEGLK